MLELEERPVGGDSEHPLGGASADDAARCETEAATTWTAANALQTMTGAPPAATNTTELVDELVAELLMPNRLVHGTDELPPPSGTWAYDASAGSIVGGCDAVR